MKPPKCTTVVHIVGSGYPWLIKQQLKKHADNNLVSLSLSLSPCLYVDRQVCNFANIQSLRIHEMQMNSPIYGLGSQVKYSVVGWSWSEDGWKVARWLELEISGYGYMAYKRSWRRGDRSRRRLIMVEKMLKSSLRSSHELECENLTWSAGGLWLRRRVRGGFCVGVAVRGHGPGRIISRWSIHSVSFYVKVKALLPFLLWDFFLEWRLDFRCFSFSV